MKELFKPKITLRKTLGHLKTVIVHKYWVFKYACILGIPWRGLKHDMSKFSPVEFWESVRYWDGKSSPIPKCKKDIGYSRAWQHHKGHNTHHYEYWVDYLDDGGKPIKMPWKDLLELVADWLGAGRAYEKGKFTLAGEKDYVLKKLKTAKIHSDTKKTIEYLFTLFAMDPTMLYSFKENEKRFKGWYECSEYGSMRFFT